MMVEHNTDTRCVVIGDAQCGCAKRVARMGPSRWWVFDKVSAATTITEHDHTKHTQAVRELVEQLAQLCVSGVLWYTHGVQCLCTVDG